MIPALYGLYRSIHLNYGAAAGFFAANETRAGLAGIMSGMETPATVLSVQAMDKALAMDGIRDRTNFLVSQGLMKQAEKMLSDEQKLKKRLMALGVLYP